MELLTNEYKELDERINFFNTSTVSNYIGPGSMQRISFINKSQHKSKIVRKDSKNISRANISKRESVDEYKIIKRQELSI